MNWFIGYETVGLYSIKILRIEYPVDWKKIFGIDTELLSEGSRPKSEVAYIARCGNSEGNMETLNRSRKKQVLRVAQRDDLRFSSCVVRSSEHLEAFIRLSIWMRLNNVVRCFRNTLVFSWSRSHMLVVKLPVVVASTRIKVKTRVRG